MKHSNLFVVWYLQRVRHGLETDQIVQINRRMTAFQRKKLESTPFKWLLCLEEPIQLSDALLRQLISRWSTDHKCFRIRQHLVPFSGLDVYMGVGLGITGKPVRLGYDNEGLVKNLFQREAITINTIVEKLSEKEINDKSHVDDFCRLYILLAFAAFYFPLTSMEVCIYPLSLLDRLEHLHLYNWGEAVHALLVRSLNHASEVFRTQKNASNLHLAGCVAVLQVSVTLFIVKHV